MRVPQLVVADKDYNLIGVAESDSNDDGTDDVDQTWVVFRTSAVAGNHAQTGVWIAVDRTGANVEDAGGVDFTGSTAYYVYNSAVGAPVGNPVQVFFGHDATSGEDINPEDVRTPEGYLVYYDAVNDRVYLVKDGSTTYRFDDASAPGEWDTSSHPIAAHVRDHQETYDWREAINDDQDFDGLPDDEESTKGTDPEDADTDNDGLSDGREFVYGTSPTSPDSDSDGVQDGTELGLTVGTLDTSGAFVPDADPSTRTDPKDDDSDDDGLEDGEEDNGAGPGTACDGKYEGGESDPRDADTDDDGLADGAEAAVGGDPVLFDRDGDGLRDGTRRRVVRLPKAPSLRNPPS